MSLEASVAGCISVSEERVMSGSLRQGQRALGPIIQLGLIASQAGHFRLNGDRLNGMPARMTA